jgi:hypothetical protein
MNKRIPYIIPYIEEDRPTEIDSLGVIQEEDGTRLFLDVEPLKEYETANTDDNCKRSYLVPDMPIDRSALVMNSAFCATDKNIQDARMVLQDQVEPILHLYREYNDILKETKIMFDEIKHESVDFLTITTANSAKWLQPMTIFYPEIFNSPFTNQNIDTINNWLKQFFPVKNEDGTLNYVENQKFLVNCYVRSSQQLINTVDQLQSYCNCQTSSGLIRLHCRTIIKGGWIHCHQGSFNCNRTINCYPEKNVDCWYETPYIKRNGLPITGQDTIPAKQAVRSQIKTNITLNYTETKENAIESLIFSVLDCDWRYVGSNLNT